MIAVSKADLIVGDRIEVSEPSSGGLEVWLKGTVTRLDAGGEVYATRDDGLIFRLRPKDTVMRAHRDSEKGVSGPFAPEPKDTAMRKDSGKDPWDLLPFDAVGEVVKVLHFGAFVKNYGARNWELGMSRGRCVASLMRHLCSWTLGQRVDAESGLSHLAHLACNALFLLTYELRDIGEKDVGPK